MTLLPPGADVWANLRLFTASCWKSSASWAELTITHRYLTSRLYVAMCGLCSATWEYSNLESFFTCVSVININIAVFGMWRGIVWVKYQRFGEHSTFAYTITIWNHFPPPILILCSISIIVLKLKSGRREPKYTETVQVPLCSLEISHTWLYRGSAMVSVVRSQQLPDLWNGSYTTPATKKLK